MTNRFTILLLGTMAQAVATFSHAQSLERGGEIADVGLFVQGQSYEAVSGGGDDRDQNQSREYLFGLARQFMEDAFIPSLDQLIDSELNRDVVRLDPDNPEKLIVQKLITDQDVELFKTFQDQSIAQLMDNLEEINPTLVARYLEYIEHGLFGDSAPETLQGIAGMAVIGFLENAFASLGLDFFWHTRYRAGKTVDFHRNPDDGSGSLKVIGVEKHFYSTDNRLFLKQIRDWTVEIEPGGFEIFERGDDTTDPFPGVDLDVDQGRLPDHMKDPTDIRSIWGRGLLTKLHARGKKVVVKEMSQRYQWMSSGVLIESDTIDYKDTDAIRHSAVNPSDDSCIDYLFSMNPPPEFHYEFPTQRGYCLGRCATPDIINSF